MHQGFERFQVIYGVLGSVVAFFERFQVIYGVLDSVITFYLWHSKLRGKGEGIDGHGKWRISSVDQVIEVTGHSPSKSVHHKVHPFLHHLHLSDYVRWNCDDNGWATHV